MFDPRTPIITLSAYYTLYIHSNSIAESLLIAWYSVGIPAGRLNRDPRAFWIHLPEDLILRSYRLFTGSAGSTAGIARVVIVVYGELIAGAWDGCKIVDGLSRQASSPFTSALTYPGIVSVFRFVIIKICIIPLMTSSRVQQRVRSWTPRFVLRFFERVHKFHVKCLYTSLLQSRLWLKWNRGCICPIN